MPSLTHPDTTVAPSSAERPIPSRRSKHLPRPHSVQGCGQVAAGTSPNGSWQTLRMNAPCPVRRSRRRGPGRPSGFVVCPARPGEQEAHDGEENSGRGGHALPEGRLLCDCRPDEAVHQRS